MTDLLPAYAAYWLLEKDTSPPRAVLQTSLVVSVSHIILALWDQGAIHILENHHLAARDLMFFASDLAGVLIVLPYAMVTSKQSWRKIGGGVAGLSTSYLLLKSVVDSE